MKNIKFLICFLMVVYAFLNNYFTNFLGSFYTFYINPLIWFFLFLICFFNFRRRTYIKKGIFENIIIASLFYLIIYYLLGLIFGYVKSPYSHNLISIFKNAIAFLLPVIFEEYIRCFLVSRSGKFYHYFFYVFLFSFIQIDVRSIDFQVVFSTIIPIIVRNWLLVYIAFNLGYKCCLIYRIPIIISYLLFPVFPSLSWFVEASIDLVYSFIVFSIVYRFNYRTRKRRNKPIGIIFFIIILILIVCFVAGIFRYVPVAIMSNSMYDVIKRGDVVIVKKLNFNEINSLNVNDIIQYKYEDHTIIHRIVKVIKDDNIYFITKGDYNDTADIDPVLTDQVIGVVHYKIPYIGYPSVFVSQFFN